MTRVWPTFGLKRIGKSSLVRIAFGATVVGGLLAGSALAQPTVDPSEVATPEIAQTSAQINAQISAPNELNRRIAQSRLLNIEQVPLFLPADKGKLVAASNRLSPTQISQPSLSWIRDQEGNRYGSDRLISQWQAYQLDDGSRYVDVVVNEQIWSLLNYFERYAFILHFGTAAKRDRYQLRVFHSGDAANQSETGDTRRASASLVRIRGAYFCNFEAIPTAASVAELPCTIVLDESSRREVNRPF
ncbi:MAG: hypothetical protein WBC73_16230 [Phormidesmis sp.]